MSVMSIISGLLSVIMFFSSGNVFSPDVSETQPILPEVPADAEAVVPETDAAGRSVDFFLAYDMFSADFVADEEQGDFVSNSVFARNSEVEEYFNTKLNFTVHNSSGSTALPLMKVMIQAGDDTYEVFIGSYQETLPAVSYGYFVDWNDMPFVNLENPWWNKRINDSINYGRSYYAVTGDFNLHNTKKTGCLVFNKTVMEDFELEYPYNLVREGKWTADKFIEYVKAGQSDINGDNAMTPDEDCFGYSGFKHHMIPNLYYGFGQNFVVKQGENLPSFNIGTENTLAAIDKMIEVFSTGNGVWCSEDFAEPGEMFGSSRLMFMDTTISSLASLRDISDIFGVVPYPKFDENQKSYISPIAGFSSVAFIPHSNTDTVLTGAVMEYMAYLSYRDVMPIYRDIELQIKSAPDIMSEEMLEIIIDGNVFCDDTFIKGSDLVTMAVSGKNTVDSIYEKNSVQWTKKLSEMIEFWKE